jgi:arsenic resistance protein ArsH
MKATDGLPNVGREQFRVPRDEDFARATPSTHPPRILLLYGSLRQRSYSRLLAEEASRLLNAMGAETRFFNPADLPLPDEKPDTHPKVRELRELADWAEGMVWSSPERHGAMSAVLKAQIDWIPLSVGSVRPTQGKTLAVMQVCGGSQSFNAVNQMRVLGRWMRMITIPNQSSVAKAYQEFDDAGRMKPSSYYDRVVDVMEELMKFTLLTRDVSAHLVDRYSERKEHAAAMSRGTDDHVDRVASLVAAPSSQRIEKRIVASTPPAHRSDELSESTAACCGGPPKHMAEACCVKDEAAKAAGHTSCGCSQEHSSVGSKQACCR